MSEETRVRLGFHPTAKGTISLDVTAESETATETARLLRDGIERFRQIAADEGFQVIEGNLEK